MEGRSEYVWLLIRLTPEEKAEIRNAYDDRRLYEHHQYGMTEILSKYLPTKYYDGYKGHENYTLNSGHVAYKAATLLHERLRDSFRTIDLNDEELVRELLLTPSLISAGKWIKTKITMAPLALWY